MDRGGGLRYHVFSSKVFVSHNTEKFRRGTLVFQKGSGVEIFLDNRSITIFSIFLSHTAEKFRRGAILCFRMFRVSKHFMPNVVSQYRKNSLVIPSVFHKAFSKNFMETRGGGRITFFCQNFWSKCRKISYWNPLVRHFFRVSKNFMLKRVMSRFNVEIFLSHSTEKKLLQHFGVSENFGY